MKHILLPLLASVVLAAQGRDAIDLAGTWQFSMASPTYDDTITLPGSMLTNGKGNDVTPETQWTGSLYDKSYYFSDRYAKYREPGNIKFPFFLTPDKEYVGDAFYRRTVSVPKSWKGQRIVLHLERAHIETTLKVNGHEVGHRMSLSTPHEYDVTDYIRPGKDNEIEIKIYNGIENVCVGQDSHSVTDQTQGNWNGIVGDIELRAMPKNLSISRVRVYPDVKNRRATVKALLNGKMGRKTKALATAFPNGDMSKAVASSAPTVSGDTLTFTLDLGDGMLTWDEFEPNVYDLIVAVGDDAASTTFGMRDIATGFREITVNGIPTFMRGTVENCCFPLTGYAPTDEESWKEVFDKCKEYGINMMRFHSYCPPEAAFAAADKAGVYLQPEGPSWPNHGVKLGVGMNIDQYLLDESKAIVDAYGNHPSFVMMAAGNEPAGPWVEYTADWVKQMKAYDPTKIYSSASVGGGWQWDEGSEYHVRGGARGLEWSRRRPGSADDFAADMDRPRNFKPTGTDTLNTHPILAHEAGQWCVFPDFKEMSLYTGPYKARNFEIFQETLAENGMASMAEKFLQASGKLQALCYKYDIERNLRTPGYPGFQLLALNDYSGQGTALEGVLNVFWKEKGYIDGEKWRQSCAPVVVMAELPKFVYTNSDSLVYDISVYNATTAPLEGASLRVVETFPDGTVEVDYTSPCIHKIKVGKTRPIAREIRHSLKDYPVGKHKIRLELGDVAVNEYDFWVYPDSLPTVADSDVYVADSLDSKALEVLENGGKVLLTAAGKVTLGDDVVQHYLPVFWNTSWFKMRPPHTTGATIDTSHPLFAHGFPTDDWGNLNWWELLNRAQVMNFVDLPKEYQSPIQPIDTWHVNRKLGMLLEANVLNGKLLMTTMDITGNLDSRPVARQMRHAIDSYMASEDFAPTLKLEPATVADFFTKRTAPIEMFTNETPDELKPKFKQSN